MKIILINILLLTFVLSKDICITNFNKKVCKDFTVLNSVIVKSPLSKQELKDKLNKPLKQIAFLEDSNLYLIDSNNSLEYSKELSKKEYITYAQPNISQKRDHNIKVSQNITKKYSLEKIWTKTKGEGVNIAVIDDGFNLKHEDLKGVNVLFSYDVDNKTLTSDPKISIDTHGTQVVGVIFAQHNGIGVDGISPNSNLIAIRQTSNITSDTVIAFTVAQKAKADIINCSWNSPVLLEPIYDLIKSMSKDIAIVISAGNNKQKIEPFSTEASIDEAITVGATQSYSNYGDKIDFKIRSGITTTKANGKYGNFGGTSATAPIISGLLALKVSQNKDKPIKQIVKNLKKEINGN
ncbi:MAG: S8/S53 family peptidase [Campylobacterota bacterium]|nr:S8/S53 family peptidase [Campylobacterota bacterium]